MGEISITKLLELRRYRSRPGLAKLRTLADLERLLKRSRRR
ncbi:hypothetical protein [Escherichia fergusonii]|nr:hypothetical protein [Escherichia fergusonii]